MDNWFPEDNRYLSILLDGVTGTEDIIKMRQDFCKIHDCLYAQFLHGLSKYFTGSKAEAFYLPGSDMDYILDINAYYAIGVSESLHELAQSTQANKFLLITDNVSPGYVLIKCANQTQNANLLNSCVIFRNAAYLRLSSALFVSSSLELPSNQGHALTIQGPSLEVRNKYRDVSGPGVDNVLSIHCNFWPTSAAGWIDRPRHYEWPSREDREKKYFIRMLPCPCRSQEVTNGTHTMETIVRSRREDVGVFIQSYTNAVLCCHESRAQRIY